MVSAQSSQSQHRTGEMCFIKSQLVGIVTATFPWPGGWWGGGVVCGEGGEGERVGLLQGVSLSFRSEQRDFAVGKGGREEPSGAPPGGRTRNGEGWEGDGERATKT